MPIEGEMFCNGIPKCLSSGQVWSAFTLLIVPQIRLN